MPSARFLNQTNKIRETELKIYPSSFVISAYLLLKTFLRLHQTIVRRTGFRATLRLRLFSISAWENLFCLQWLIALNWGVNQSDWCYCITKSALVVGNSLEKYCSCMSETSLTQHSFQILKKLGVKSYDLFLWTERFQRNLNYFRVHLPLDFSEIFNIFRIKVFPFFFKNSRKSSKKT